MWNLIVSVRDHCLSFYFFFFLLKSMKAFIISKDILKN